MFLMNSWYVAAWDHELIDGKLLARTILGKPVLLYKGESGRVVALDNRCCHRGAKLSNGRMEGDDVRCMYHGLKFDPSGKCIQIPGPALKVSCGVARWRARTSKKASVPWSLLSISLATRSVALSQRQV